VRNQSGPIRSNINYSFPNAILCCCEGGYLIWSWIRKKKTIVLGLVGGVILFVYGILQTLQPSNFGRVYAAYGGIFVVFSVIWGILIDKKKPDRFEVIGSLIVLSGAAIIFYAPR